MNYSRLNQKLDNEDFFSGEISFDLKTLTSSRTKKLETSFRRSTGHPVYLNAFSKAHPGGAH